VADLERMCQPRRNRLEIGLQERISACFFVRYNVNEFPKIRIIFRRHVDIEEAQEDGIIRVRCLLS
jgi:hypothetical protein